MNRVTKGLLASALMVGATGSAEATVFTFSFNAPLIHAPDSVVVGQGTIDADDTGNGVYTVKGATGTADEAGFANEVIGASGTITSSAGGFVTNNLMFKTAKGTGVYGFSLNKDGTSYDAMFGEIGSDSATLSLTTGIAAVPEPVTWGMMVVGFAMVGGLMRPRRRGVQVVSA